MKVHPDHAAQIVETRVVEKLRGAGIRPTRQRIALGKLLFADGDKHVTAECLHAIAHEANLPVSLATVYNTLKHFSRSGLLREVATPGHTTYFDTNTSDHYHYFIERTGRIVDIPDCKPTVEGIPELPLGKRIGRIDVIVHLKD